MKKAFIVIPLLVCFVSSCFNNKESTTISNGSTSFMENITETKAIESNLDLNTLNGLSGLTPSLGNINILLIPIHFNDIEDNNMNIDVLNNVFNGTLNENMSWYSVSEFYEKSSYGKCHLNFEITPVYETINSYSYYCSNYNNKNYTDASDKILNEALSYFDMQYDYSLFDNDNDGYIDGIYLVYDAPVDTNNNNNLWWAYTYYFANDLITFDNKKVKSYVFAGYDFLYVDSSNNKPDSHTFIHEMAHMFGIDDYYDYQAGIGKKEGGLAGGDIMDGTIGDHNSFTKALLKWNKGTLIQPSDSIIVELDAMQNNGDFIILANDFNLSKNFAQEFFVLEYYTNTNLQEYDKIFSIPGIRMLHINGKLDSNCKFLYNNSYTTNKFISQITSSKGATYLSNTTSRSDYSLFTVGKELIEVKYDTGEKLNYSFNVKELLDNKAIIEIKKIS